MTMNSSRSFFDDLSQPCIFTPNLSYVMISVRASAPYYRWRWTSDEKIVVLAARVRESENARVTDTHQLTLVSILLLIFRQLWASEQIFLFISRSHFHTQRAAQRANERSMDMKIPTRRPDDRERFTWGLSIYLWEGKNKQRKKRTMTDEELSHRASWALHVRKDEKNVLNFPSFFFIYFQRELARGARWRKIEKIFSFRVSCLWLVSTTVQLRWYSFWAQKTIS